jgi:hypothetical protein
VRFRSSVVEGRSDVTNKKSPSKTLGDKNPESVERTWTLRTLALLTAWCSQTRRQFSQLAVGASKVTLGWADQIPKHIDLPA